MVLPLPVKPGAGEHAVSFINLKLSRSRNRHPSFSPLHRGPVFLKKRGTRVVLP